MVDNIIRKPLGLVLIVTAHMVFNGPCYAVVTGIRGNNITLQFTFNDSIKNSSYIGVYKGLEEKKIADCLKQSKGTGCCDIYPKNSTVFYHITNLRLDDSEIYWASLFDGSAQVSSNKVQLKVQKDNRRTTVPPMLTAFSIPEDSGSFFSFHIVIVLVVLPVVLLATVLPFLICSLMKTKDKQQEQQQPSSTPTVQETVEASSNVPAPSLVYSVLDFPKRHPAVVEINPRDTEYAAVSYLPEKRRL